MTDENELDETVGSENPERFLGAQKNDYERALAEIRSGSKRSHWMWFIFPQLKGLGRSSTAQYYAIKNEQEARAYLAHPVLGPRLLQCAEAILSVDGRSVTDILGSPDDVKLRSCATLFGHISPPGSVFVRVIERYYQGCPDHRTLQLLGVEAWIPR